MAAGGGADQRGVVGAELVPAGAADTPALEIPARQQLGPPPADTDFGNIFITTSSLCRLPDCGRGGVYVAGEHLLPRHDVRGGHAGVGVGGLRAPHVPAGGRYCQVNLCFR